MEWKRPAGAESIREVIELPGTQRVGHGARLEEDPPLLEPPRQQGIALQMGPTRDVQTRAIPTLAKHPIDRYIKENLPVTVNTDGRVTSTTILTQELLGLVRQSGWGLDQTQGTILTATGRLLLVEDGNAALQRTIPDRWPDP